MCKFIIIIVLIVVSVYELINEVIQKLHPSHMLKMDPPIVVIEVVGMIIINLFFVTMGFDMDRFSIIMSSEEKNPAGSFEGLPIEEHPLPNQAANLLPQPIYQY